MRSKISRIPIINGETGFKPDLTLPDDIAELNSA
jgi:hypothetical protein